jgi:hypothetical protein
VPRTHLSQEVRALQVRETQEADADAIETLREMVEGALMGDIGTGNSLLTVVCDYSWRLVHGSPPHQLWETLICGLLMLNAFLASFYHVGESENLNNAQRILNIIM